MLKGSCINSASGTKGIFGLPDEYGGRVFSDAANDAITLAPSHSRTLARGHAPPVDQKRYIFCMEKQTAAGSSGSDVSTAIARMSLLKGCSDIAPRKALCRKRSTN